jgi:hypothetical protein
VCRIPALRLDAAEPIGVSIVCAHTHRGGSHGRSIARRKRAPVRFLAGADWGLISFLNVLW